MRLPFPNGTPLGRRLRPTTIKLIQPTTSVALTTPFDGPFINISNSVALKLLQSASRESFTDLASRPMLTFLA